MNADANAIEPRASAARSRPHIVIIGGGFGGLYAARKLRKAPVELTVIDRRNHHLFQPLLYQVATAALNPGDIAAPIRRILRKQRNARVILAEARAIDLDGRRVVLDDGELAYDYLIVATGATHSYFGHPQWARLAPGLKSIEDALEMRRRILLAYEMAERMPAQALRTQWTTFVVVGAGPTGVELAGAIAEIAHKTIERDFRQIDPTETRVLLLEAGERILASYPEPLSTAGSRQLQRLGVEVRTGKAVTKIEPDGVRVGDDWISARTILWAAGVAASPLAATLGVPLDRQGRVHVTETLTVPGHPEVFVIGDLAHLEQDGRVVPGVAPAAIQQGKHVAHNIRRALRSEGLEAFRYRDKGSLATIGRAAGIADLGRVQLSGRLAWLMWLFVHIAYLIGFRNRVVVLFEWAWSYVTYDRGARLITGTAHIAEPTALPVSSDGRARRMPSAAAHDVGEVEGASLDSFPASESR